MRFKKKILSAFLAGGILFNCGNVLADTVQDNFMKFKEVYLAENNDNRAFMINADFFGPSHSTEISGRAFILRDATMRMTGQINWEFTNPTTNLITKEDFPYYVEQNGDKMTMFVQRDGKWNKISFPAIPVGISNAFITSDVNILQENMTVVKTVEILKDDSNQRIMNVTLDGEKLAGLLQKYNSDSSEDFVRHMISAVKKTDLICTWTVNKNNLRTISATFDLTKLVHAYGKDYLDEAAEGKIILSQEDRSYYEVLGYYSELHLIMNYQNSAEQISMPQGASSAVTNQNIFADLVQKISQTKR